MVRPGRTTDKVRLTCGLAGLNLIAKERGELEKRRAQDGHAVEWLGPFPNHALNSQAVTGGSADFSFGGSPTTALAAIIARSPLIFWRALEKYKVDRSKAEFVYLNPPDAAPALPSGKVDAWSMWSLGVDMVPLEYKAHDIFIDRRDLDFQIDFTSYLTTCAFTTKNPALVQTVNKAFREEGQWPSENNREAEYIAQKRSNYSDRICDRFIRMKRGFRLGGREIIQPASTAEGCWPDFSIKAELRFKLMLL